jgi:pimeloyl-ACP methyl ester carboxylesterase
MPVAPANGIELHYEEFGHRDAPPLLLIMGLGGQLLLWDERFCRRLAERGFRVIRYDNRDVGLSTKFDDACPDPQPLVARLFRREPVSPPYTLDDMADDAAGLLAALGIDSAHIVGTSMGGAIAQAFALRYPARTRSLTSIMSSPGGEDRPLGNREVLRKLSAPPPADPDAALQHQLELFRLMHGDRNPADAERQLELWKQCLARGDDTRGQARQMLATRTAPSRREALGGLRVPALVVHGAADPLVPVEGGIATAEAIPGARLLLIDGIGHGIAEAAWPRIIDAIEELARQASPRPART